MKFSDPSRMEANVSVTRSALLALGLCGLAAVPATAQARSTIMASATVIDLSEARATVQAANSLLSQTPAGHQLMPANSRRDIASATVIVTYADRKDSASALDAAVAILCW